MVTADRVFAGTAAQADAIIPHEAGLVAIDRKTGGVPWCHPVPFAQGFDRAGFIGSSAKAGDLLIAVTYDGNVIALPLH